MEKKPIATLKEVTKKIGGRTIVDRVTLDLFPGEVFGFLGPNGAGKTTTIRMLVGLIKMSSGQVHLNGYDIEKNFEKAIAQVGGIIENPEMYAFLTGYDNLIHYSRMIPFKLDEARIEEVIELVGLKNAIYNKVKTYSLGMRQRLGLAQALLHSPSLLILDEPTNGLDPAGIREIREYIRRIAHEEKMAVFVSSHLLAEMQLMCDRIGIIKQGKLIQVEKVDEYVADRDHLVTRFEVHPVQGAYELIKSKYPNATLFEDKEIELVMKREEIPRLIKEVVQSDYKVYGIMRKQQTLEDTFLEMTGDK